VKPWTYIVGGISVAIVAALAFLFLMEGRGATEATPAIAPIEFDEPLATGPTTQVGELTSESPPRPEQIEEEGVVETLLNAVSNPKGDERQVVEIESAFAGYLVDSEGQPIEGAVVSWTPVGDEVLHPYATFLSLREFVADESQEAVSDAEGVFAFETQPEILTENGSVVWITHLRFAPQFLRLGSNSESWTQWGRYELASADPEIAIVLDQNGEGVGGATVRQIAYSDASAENDDPVLSRLAYLLNRTVVSGPDGNCERHIFPGEQQVTAELGDVCATPWVGKNEGEITLTLLPTIAISGTIDWSAFDKDLNELVPHRDQAVIAVEVLIGQRRVQLEEIACTTESWGPLKQPYFPGAEYRFRMDVPALVPKEVSAFPKHAGEEVWVDFVAEHGEWVWFFVGDEAEEPLDDAVGIFSWVVDGRRVEQYIGTRPGYPGYMVVPGCPPGILMGEIACEGFQTVKIEPLTIPQEENLAQVIQLEPGGLLQGKCLLDGKPVEDFEVCYWFRTDRAMRLSFTDRTDGSFEINGAPYAKLSIAAGAAGVGMSDIAQVDFTKGEAGEVILNLQTGRTAIGSVVDNRTGRAIASATIQAMFSERTVATGDLGYRIPVDSDGEFEIEGFGNGAAVLAVEAPGYAKSLVPFSTSGAAITNVGVIRLSEFRPLTIAVRTTVELDPAQFVVSLSGPQDYGSRTPASDGLVSYESVVPGFYQINAKLPDGTYRRLSVRLEIEDDEWFEELLVDGASTVHIEVYPEANSGLPSNLAVLASSTSGRRVRSVTNPLDDSGRVSLSNMSAGEYQIVIFGDAGSQSQALAQKSVALGHYDEQTVQIQLGEPTCRFRVVDAKGMPISGVNVDVNVPDGGGKWRDVDRTDASGEFEVPGYTEPRILLSLSHPVHGNRLAFEVDTDYTGEVTEVTLEGNLDVSIVIQDADGPLVGLSATAGDRANTYNLTSSLSDSSGKAIFKKLTPGVYVVNFEHVDHWTYFEEVEIFEDSDPIVINALRRCDVRIETYTNGLPRPNIAMDIGCTEASLDASLLLANGSIDADQKELRTDSSGILNLSRLPEGKLVWRVWLDEGQIYETIEISPDNENVLRIEIPE